MAAAITAYARIHMHHYISRDDCHYIDTDSFLLNGLLPDLDISSMELVIKYKGVAKSLVTPKWYKKQYENLNRTTEAVVKTLFYVNWKTLDVGERPINVHLGSPTKSKREAVYDNNNAWVDTKPFHVIDYAGQEIRVLEWKLHSLQKEYELLTATINKYKDGKSQNSDGKSQNSDGKSQNSDDSNKYTIQTSSDPMRSSIQNLEPRQAPTLYIHPPKKSKRKKKWKKKRKK
ncbi:DNA polymerase-like [Solanum tuberosum]|uniref:DNA polymerase-like n=1 Tax=Solanum tuberosum TaxID=4113 RepID=UPI000739FE7D|nr:PREDICTED: DNA polymerase-like [Solanum tuberosum]